MMTFYTVESLENINDKLPCGRAVLFSENDRSLGEALAHKGRRILEIKVSEQIIGDLGELLLIVKKTEDYDFLLSEGGIGATAAAKVVGSITKLPVFSLYDGSGDCELFLDAATVYDGNRLSYYTPSEFTVFYVPSVVENESLDSVRRGIGTLFALGMTMFDSLFDKLADGKLRESERLWDMLHLWQESMKKLESKEISELPRFLAEKLIYFAKEGLFESKSLPFQLSFLISLYKNGFRAYNNYTFAAALAIDYLYAAYLEKDLSGGLIAPDRYELLEITAKKCKLSLSSIISNTKKTRNVVQEGAVIKEYRRDMLALLRQKEGIAKLYRRFRAADSGRWQENISAVELILLTLLASEITENATVASQLMSAGFDIFNKVKN